MKKPEYKAGFNKKIIKANSTGMYGATCAVKKGGNLFLFVAIDIEIEHVGQ